MFRFVFVFVFLTSIVFAGSKTRVLKLDGPNAFAVMSVLQNRENIKIIKNKGVKYFEKLNEDLFEAIKNENIKDMQKFIKKGADVRTGIYYAARENKINALKELLKYDKIDLKNELYFLPYKYFTDEDKKYGYNANEFIINGDVVLYKTYNNGFLTIIPVFRTMNLEAIKLVLENSINYKYIDPTSMYGMMVYVDSFEKLDYLISFWKIDILNDYSFIKEFFRNGNHELIIPFLKKYEKHLNLKENEGLFYMIGIILSGREDYLNKTFSKDEIFKYLKKFNMPNLFLYHKEDFDKIFNSKYKDLKKIKIDFDVANFLLRMFVFYYKDCNKYDVKTDKFIEDYVPECIEQHNNCSKLKNFLYFIEDYNSVPISYFCTQKEYFNDIEKITDFNKRRSNGEYPIFEVLKPRNLELLEYMLKKGANPNIIKKGYWLGNLSLYTPMDDAIVERNKEAIKILKNYNAVRFCGLYNYLCNDGGVLDGHHFRVDDVEIDTNKCK